MVWLVLAVLLFLGCRHLWYMPEVPKDFWTQKDWDRWQKRHGRRWDRDRP